ncbi:interferon alpha/beta receptor 2 [Suncus etruscus]|uniref:interferon alpha/beta receptor 2 n=1 Tax=Suncus etruscus TaxID=109475 RepID=UPI00210FEA17|nr:interferon alpha/beta receptor 2 [Suncus etruscus]
MRTGAPSAALGPAARSLRWTLGDTGQTLHHPSASERQEGHRTPERVPGPGEGGPEGSCETRLARCESGHLGLTAKMLWSLNAWALRSLPRNLLGLLGFLLRISATLPGAEDQVCTLQMTLRNFRPILSWEFPNPEFVPTHYTLSYTIMSKNKAMKMVENCVQITKPFCDLTDEWQELGETYILSVVGSRGNRTLRCMGDIQLTNNMYLEPPKFEIRGFLDHIEVIIHFPLHVSRIIEELLINIPLVIEEQSEAMVKRYKPKIHGNNVGNFSYIIDKLIPNMNYCISVYFERRNPDLASAVQCTLLHEPDSSDSGILGGIIFLFVMVAVITSLLLIMKRAGYICLRRDFPKVLNFCNMSAYVFLDMPRPEKTDLIEEVIVKKKKVCNHDDYNDDDDDESDSEDEEASETSPGGYTMHGLVGRLLSSTSSSITLDGPQDSTSEDAAPAEPEAGTELPAVPRSDSLHWECTMRACEGTGDQPKDPFAEEEATSTEGSGDSRIVFNVDLKSVCVRSLEDELSRDSLMPTMLPEGSMDLQDPDDMDLGQMENSVVGTWLTLAEELWSEDGDPSEESDTQSKSDFCFGDGYIAR